MIKELKGNINPEEAEKVAKEFYTKVFPKNPHAVALGRQGGLARRGKPGRKLSSEEARRIRAIRTEKLKQQKA